MRLIPLLALIALTAGCATHGRVDNLDDGHPNPYAKTYVKRLEVAGSRHTPPELYRGDDRGADYQRQLERGYDMLGSSSFEAGDVDPEMLAEQAVRVNADMVLVYTAVAGKEPALVTLDRAKSAAVKETGSAGGKENVAAGKLLPIGRNIRYSYFATYWTKLSPPVLGVHVQGVAETVTGEPGLQVIAVIEDSPAASELQKGDILLQLGTTRLEKPDQLIGAARRHAGQAVEVVFQREGETLRKQLVLGSR